VRPRTPTVEEVRAAEGKRLPDVLGPDLSVVFCGINPGLYSAAVGCHFARPGNRFWKALHAAGFTDRLLSPFEQRDLLEYGCGLTNLVARATAVAAALRDEELRQGRGILKRKIGRHRPRCVAILGIGAYRKAFRRPDAGVGPQDDDIAGALVWLLPNPSGLNAHYRPPDLAKLFGELRAAIGGRPGRSPRRRGKR
jgi:TDG/mug DNA glycosylase family protein